MRNGNAGQKLRRISVRRKTLPELPARLGYSSLSYSRHIRRHERVQLLFATKSCQYAENLQRALSFKISSLVQLWLVGGGGGS